MGEWVEGGDGWEWGRVLQAAPPRAGVMGTSLTSLLFFLKAQSFFFLSLAGQGI